MWGSAPRPGRGIIPLHPVIGATPQGFRVWGLFSALGLRTHLGLGYGHEKDVRQRERPRRVCRGPSSYQKKTRCGRSLPPPLFRINISSRKRSRAKRLARGFGAKPQMGTQSQSKSATQTHNPLGLRPTSSPSHGFIFYANRPNARRNSSLSMVVTPFHQFWATAHSPG